jgi:hypothetical protein
LQEKIKKAQEGLAALKESKPEVLKSLPEISNLKVNQPYEFQDTHQEKVIHSGWNSGNAYRHILEGTGDIFRESAKHIGQDVEFVDPGYIGEKIRRIKSHLEDIKIGRIMNEGETFEAAYKSHPEKFKQMEEQWKKQPVKTKLQEKARQLNLAMLKKDFVTAKKIIPEIEEAIKTQKTALEPLSEEKNYYRAVEDQLKHMRDTGYEPEKAYRFFLKLKPDEQKIVLKNLETTDISKRLNVIKEQGLKIYKHDSKKSAMEAINKKFKHESIPNEFKEMVKKSIIDEHQQNKNQFIKDIQEEIKIRKERLDKLPYDRKRIKYYTTKDLLDTSEEELEEKHRKENSQLFEKGKDYLTGMGPDADKKIEDVDLDTVDDEWEKTIETQNEAEPSAQELIDEVKGEK